MLLFNEFQINTPTVIPNTAEESAIRDNLRITLFLIILLVEFLLAYSPRKDLLADSHAHFGARRRKLLLYQGHADTFPGGDGIISCRDLANLLSVRLDRIACTGNGLVLQLNADDLAGDATGLLPFNGILADEFRLVHLHEHPEPGLYRGYLCTQFMSVQRKSHFEAQGIPASQPARSDSGGKQPFPEEA